MRLDNEKLLSHIVDEDQLFNMRRILDQVRIVLNRHLVVSTDFMNPYAIGLAQSLLNRFIDISYREIGGIRGAERKVIMIFPHYYQYEDLELPIKALEIQGNIGKLDHRDFLGGILNLGINREKIGDILIHEDFVQLIVKKEISRFILMNLARIGKERIRVKEVSLKKLRLMDVEYKDIKASVSSLRLDALISRGWNLSRKESQSLIGAGKVKLNWEPVDKISKEVKEGDLISVRGFGRFILGAINGVNKKGRIRIIIRLLK